MALRKIFLKGNELPKEGLAAAIITPGELVEWATATTIQPHGTAGGNTVPG